MNYWRDGANKYRTLEVGSASQLTGITAGQPLTLSSGSNTIDIPAGTLQVGDTLRIKGLVSSTYSTGTWLMYVTADLTEATYMVRHPMTVAANTTDFDVHFVVTNSTTLTSKLYNTSYGPGSLNSAPSTHTIDINALTQLEFFIFADGTSGANTVDLHYYSVEVIKA